jgi:hypothetical protein
MSVELAALGLGPVLLLAAIPSAQPQGTADSTNSVPPAFATFSAPGAGTGALEGTVAIGINASGEVTGFYFATGSVAHGFVRAADGAIAVFDAPGAGTGKNQGTFPIGINASGTIAGWYADSSNAYHGFVRAVNGAITAFDPPGAGMAGHRGANALAINASGQITGSYSDANALFHGFIRSASGAFTTFEAPGAGTAAYQDQGTFPMAINSSGAVTGFYQGASGGAHGFVRAANGAFSTFQAPDVATSGDYQGTNPTSIDAAGEIAGTYLDSTAARHGFVRAATGTITTFDAPGVDASPCVSKGPGTIFCGTGAVGINTAGDIAGTFLAGSGVLRGFVRAADGMVTSFDAPGAGKTAGGVEGTGGFGINDAGAIAGTYADAHSVFHGFVYVPAPTATTTTLTASQTVSVFKQPVTLTAKVGSSGGAPPNGEDVSFLSGKTVLGTKPLSDGTATLTTTALPVGADSVTAVYGGNNNFGGSTSKPVKVTVGKEKSFTALTAKPDPSSFDEPVVFTASVTGQFGAAITGTVTFLAGNSLNNAILKLGTAPVSKGTAKLTTSALPAGTATVTVEYSGDSDSASSKSGSVKQVVDQAATTTALTSSKNPSGANQSVTLTAIVKGKFGGTPTGTVTFSDGKTALKTVALSAGEAKFSTKTLTVGKHGLTVKYGGSEDFTGSSGSLTQTVN